MKLSGESNASGKDNDARLGKLCKTRPTVRLM